MDGYFVFCSPLPRRLSLTSITSSFSDSGHRAATDGSSASSPTHQTTPHNSLTEDRLITISHVNINSITSCCRLDELSHFTSLNKIDILCLSETKLDAHVHPSLFALDNFHEPLTRHRDRNGGGVAIYVRNNIAVKRLPDLELDGLEWVWCLLKIQRTTLIICTIYVPPHFSSSQHHDLIDKLNEGIALAQTYSPDNIILLGDFNAGNTYLDPTIPNHSAITPYEIMLQDQFFASNLKQLIREPTRYADNGNIANLRDLLVVSNEFLVSNSGVLPCFSNLDHLPIFATLKLASPSIPRRTIQLWDYRRMDTDKLARLLTDTDWDRVLDCDVDDATNNFTDALMTAAKAAIPLRTISPKINDKPWFNSELKRQIRKRDRLFNIAKKRNTEYDWQRWRQQRNLTTRTNQEFKNSHIQMQVNKLLENKKDPRKFHNILKGIIGRKVHRNIPPLIGQDGTPITDDLEKADIFNRHFSAQTRLDVQDKQIPRLASPDPPIAPLAEVQVTEQEVLNVLNSLNINKSSGPDKIPAKLIKMCALLISGPLSKLFNKSLSAGKFPTSWKEASVTPIFKQKGSNSDPTNYRPISLLPNLSKILEKLVFNKMYTHIVNNNLLSEKQSGYRAGHGTHIQLLYLTHKLYSALNTGQDFTAIFLDISKYFDKIWHDGLIEKCKIQYNISGQLLQWIKSYLSNRTQKVRVGNSLSMPEKIQSGCPQGSVLGPLLAIMYLNDLSHKVKNDALFYADDTSLYSSHAHDDSEDQRKIQNDLDAIKKYGEDWAITFNGQKTVQLTFTNKNDDGKFYFSFDGQDIPTMTHHKHLGLTLSTDLHFHVHINNIIRTINTVLGPIYPVRKFLSRSVLNNIYSTYILPHFDYCDIIYDGNLTVTDASRLQKLQNRCARLVTGTLFRSPSTTLLEDLGWEKLETRRLIHKLLFFHRLYYDSPPLPSYVTDMLTDTRHDATGLYLRNATTLTIPPIRLASFHQSYIPATIRKWNLLPSALRSITSHSEFSRQVWRQFGAPEPPLFYSYGTKVGNINHTRLRIGLSTLNAHLFQICHPSVASPSCSCGHPTEDTIHYVLWCPLHNIHRSVLLNEMNTLLPGFEHLSARNKLNTLLFCKNVPKDRWTTVADLFQTYIAKTQRFNNIV